MAVVTQRESWLLLAFLRGLRKFVVAERGKYVVRLW
jgi:hypothetical protein